MKFFITFIICSLLLIHLTSNIPAFAQSSDEKAIFFTNTRLQSIFVILRTNPQNINQTCLESLKKLHEFKQSVSSGSKTGAEQKEINNAILRDLSNNALEFCTMDAQEICHHNHNLDLHAECKKLPE